MAAFNKIVLILIILALTGQASAFGDQTANETSPDRVVAEPTSATETEAEPALPADEEKAKKPKKTKDPSRGRFLPIPIFITEPAIGEGLGLALAYFHRPKGNLEGRGLASPDSIGDASREQAPPPTVTGVFAAYTSNKTAVAGIGHMNSFRDDHIRFTGVVGYADVNSTFYVLDRPLKFNLEGTLVFQDTRFRFGDSKWFWGVGLSYLDASSAFQVELPEEVPVDLFRNDLRNIGLSAELAWDTRDNTSMPNHGQFFELTAWRYDEAIGGDFDYWNTKLKLLSFHRLHEKFVLGLRLDISTISGDVPFFAIPYVSLRGIPALRYQGNRVGAAEIEGRYNISPKLAVIGFGGVGSVSSYFDFLKTEQNIYAYGLGGRYRVFEAQNVWVGLDIARGPEDTYWYIQVGHAW